jgi:hypothetical protein
MKITGFLAVSLSCALFLTAQAGAEEGKGLLLDDFEGAITGGADGTVDFGAGNGSTLQASAATDIKNKGSQAMKAEYDAVPGGYMWIARGYGLDVKGAACWLVPPQEINWKDYNAISFYLYGRDSKGNIAFDLKDNGNEMWRFMVEDNFTGWKQIVCPFAQFFSRSDWQPNSADKNDILDFPIKSFQFEPLPESKGVLYFDTVELLPAQ